MHLRAAALALAIAALVANPAPASTGSGAAEARLAVWERGGWHTFWTAHRAPDRWADADPTVARGLTWTRLANGIEWTTVRLACGGPTWRCRLVIARVDPRAVRVSLDLALTRADARPAWSIERAPHDALIALNAGQFGTSMPWGLVVSDGRQLRSAGEGPMVSTVAFDAAGRVRWSHGHVMVPDRDITTAFQSYPTLLAGNGRVPSALRTAGSGVDRSHHDARLALGMTRDGRLLVVLTRFDGIGGAVDFVPLGPTAPEMAAIMGALGATDAVMLDGGISAQLLLRDDAGHVHAWPGLRNVPLGLIVRAASHAPPRARE